MSNRFELEQAILGCWNVVDDLQLFIDGYDSLSEDQRLNFLIGLKEIYLLKFQTTFDIFEKSIQNSVKS